MTLIRWRPARELKAWHPSDVLGEFDNFHSEIDTMFDRFRGGTTNESGLQTFLPAVDIAEEKDLFIVKVELPGINKSDVKITVQDDVLTVRGEKKQEKEQKESNYHRVERSYGVFQRSFTLPTSIHSERIDAEFKDGLLTINLPKVEEAKPKEIEVKVK